MIAPVLHEIAGGRLEATCGKCLAHSDAVPGPDRERAWEEIQKQGWTLYTPPRGVRSYALCAACTTNPPNVDKAVAAARKSRKRR